MTNHKTRRMIVATIEPGGIHISIGITQHAHTTRPRRMWRLVMRCKSNHSRMNWSMEKLQSIDEALLLNGWGDISHALAVRMGNLGHSIPSKRLPMHSEIAFMGHSSLVQFSPQDGCESAYGKKISNTGFYSARIMKNIWLNVQNVIWTDWGFNNFTL